MGFMDSLGHAAGKAVSFAIEKTEKFNQDYEKYSNQAASMSDEKLIAAYKCTGGSTARRIALQKELEARGYHKKEKTK